MRRLLVLAAAAFGACTLVLAATGAAGPINLGDYFFGAKLVRAEVIMFDGGAVHDYRVDRGKIRASGGGSLTLVEKDGTVVTIPVASTADIRYRGVTILLARLRRGMATTVVATP
jgi:hypothetical protein